MDDNTRLNWLEREAQRSSTGVSIEHYKETQDRSKLSGYRVSRRGWIGDIKPTVRKAIDFAMQERP